MKYNITRSSVGHCVPELIAVSSGFFSPSISGLLRLFLTGVFMGDTLRGAGYWPLGAVLMGEMTSTADVREIGG